MFRRTSVFPVSDCGDRIRKESGSFGSMPSHSPQAGVAGFSLIELMIVVAVIGIISILAVPNFMRSRLFANETSAIASLRVIVTSEITYASTVGNGSFGSTEELVAQGLIDAALGSGTKDGYNLTLTPDGSSALVVAIDNRHYELAAWLLYRGADPNADGVGWTALHTAVLAHRPHFRVVPDPSPTGNLTSGALIEALLAAGADPNAASRERVRLATQTSPLYPTEGVTPFLLAAVAADVPLMRLLLAHGADTSVTTAGGSTALMAAAGAATYAGQGAGSEADALDAVCRRLAEKLARAGEALCRLHT